MFPPGMTGTAPDPPVRHTSPTLTVVIRAVMGEEWGQSKTGAHETQDITVPNLKGALTPDWTARPTENLK